MPNALWVDLVATILVALVSTTVGICAVAGVYILVAGGVFGLDAKAHGDLIAYEFVAITPMLMLIALAVYPRWVDLRRTVRGDCTDMEMAARRAIIRWARGQPGTINKSAVTQTGRELGWYIGQRLHATQVTNWAMLFLLKVNRANGNNATPWDRVIRFRRTIFEQAILSTSETLTDYQVPAGQDITEVHRRVIDTRSNLAYEQALQAAVLCCAGILFDRARTGPTGILVTVEEDAMRHAATLAETVAVVTGNAQPSHVLTRNHGRLTFVRRAAALLQRMWRMV